jgi:high-affinity iron transporter
MFEALIITLREGVEAALVLAIALTVLDRRGLTRLKPALFAGAGVAIAVSVFASLWATRLTYDEELVEGIVMLVGAVLVLTLVWWMWKAAPRMKSDIESGIARASSSGGPSAAIGMFVFSFGMVFREGVETAVFLSAAGFNSQGLGMWLGAIVGLAIAAVFGVLFARGTLRIPLKPFFSITSAVLLLIAFQLLVGGLHELSEAEVLPASKTEMAIVGPLIKNELLLFTLTVALAAGWLLFGRGEPLPAATESEGPQARLARAARARDVSRRRWMGITALLVVGFLTTAFVTGARVPERVPATPVAVAEGAVAIDAASLRDGHLHFYETTLPEGAARFFVIDVDGDLRTCFDACEICGDQGYFEQKGSVICRNCTAPLAIKTIGRSGGCNPIPVKNRMEGNRLVIAASDLRTLLPLVKGR